MASTLPYNELQRLAALRQYQILDTAREVAFDDLTRLAAQICNTPIALITLVDEYRQWFKAKIGLDVDSTLRKVSFCTHAILQPNDILIVPDTWLDSRFATNPLVTSAPHIRFYAGAPLITPEGYALGTLCVIDRVPRELSLEQVEALRALSHQVIAQLELRRNTDILTRISTLNRQQIEDLICAFSHDLRTPLLGTRSILRSMLGGAFGPISDLLRDVLEDYCQTNEDLLKLVEALIDISRYKTNVAQNLNWEILNWEKIFVGAIAESHIIAKQKCEITYNISPSLPIVCGDEIEIQRVVENLLDNAIKVSFADKQVILDIVPLGVNEVKISVRDKGQGMTPQERERVFHRLTQGRGRLSRSGPALYLCRQIVEAHRGNIGVESNLDGGSTFWFTLPVTEERSRLEGRNSFI